jgi:hypothetical protein
MCFSPFYLWQSKYLSKGEMTKHETLFSESGQKQRNVRAMMFNTIIKNISAISWKSVLLMGETGVPGEIYLPAPITKINQ